MKRLVQKLKVIFDRTFSNHGMAQLGWLVVAMILIYSLAWLVSIFFAIQHINKGSFDSMNWSQRLIQLLIDPGAVDYVEPELRIIAQVVAIIGTIIFSGCLVSVISNLLQRHVEDYKKGLINYQLEGHIVIIGFDDMVPSLIDQICRDPKYDGCNILVQTTESAQKVKESINRALQKKNEKRVIMSNARRDSLEDLANLCTPQAREVYVIGNRDEMDHDSLNIECLRKIVQIHKQVPNCPIVPFTVFFAHHNTFSVFQVTDLGEEWRNYIEFRPFNFDEGWAKKLMVNRFYSDGTNRIEYPPLDREQLDRESLKFVHLVIIGMSRLGTALGTEAAHLMHFPNFCRDPRLMTRITFIDSNADHEMEVFRNRHRHLFQVMAADYRDFEGGDGSLQHIQQTVFTKKDAEFLDISYEFIKSRAESPGVQQLISQWAEDDGQILSIAVCLHQPKLNMNVGLYLPDAVYDRRIPVFLQQQSSAALLSMLNAKEQEGKPSRYSRVYPFGMMDNYFDLDSNDLKMAQTINYVYDYFYKHGKTPTSLPDAETMRKLWIKLPVALQWSNFYNSYSIAPKMRSLGLTKETMPDKLTDEQIDTLAYVEHHRWTMEKLLLGFRKPKAETLARIETDEAYRKYCRELYIHPDIRPYDELSEYLKDLDRIMVSCLPLIVKQS